MGELIELYFDSVGFDFFDNPYPEVEEIKVKNGEVHFWYEVTEPNVQTVSILGGTQVTLSSDSFSDNFFMLEKIFLSNHWYSITTILLLFQQRYRKLLV